MENLPSSCACGKPFDVEHALNCHLGGYVNLRHNEIRDLTAGFLKEVCKDVKVEPKLQALSGETFNLKSTIIDDDARLDISARNFWSQGSKAYFDIRIFNPTAKTYMEQSLEHAYIANEKSKKREYNSRVLEVEHATFTPLVFSILGGTGLESKAFYKRLASSIADKRNESYQEITTYIRTRLCFSLLRMALICIRGHRERKWNYKDIEELDFHEEVKKASLKC